jgi:hypothetical protein
MVAEGLRSTVGAAATPFTKGPYTWDQKMAWTIAGTALGTTPATEDHAIEINHTGTQISAGGCVGLNIVETTAGTAGAWSCGIYAKVVEGTTKNVNGYLNAAEFELSVAGTYNPSDMCVMALNSTITNTAMANCSHPAYIYLRDYGTDGGTYGGSTSMKNLFWFGDQTISGSDQDAAALLAPNTIATSTHTIRFLIGSTPYYIMCANTTHN